MALASTSYAQVQTDRYSASSLRSLPTPSRSLSVPSSGHGSITPASSLDGDVLLPDSPDTVTLRTRPTSSRENDSNHSSGIGTLVSAAASGNGLSFRKLARSNLAASNELGVGVEEVVAAKRSARDRFSSIASRTSMEGRAIQVACQPYLHRAFS